MKTDVHTRDPSNTLRRMAWFGLIVVVWIAGCADQFEPTELSPDPTEPPTAAPADSEETKADGEETKADGEKDSKLEVRTLDVRTTRAREALERNYRGFLERQPLGFSPALLKDFRTEAAPVVDQIRNIPRELKRASPIDILWASLPFLIIALFLAGYFILTLQIGRLFHRMQADLHTDLAHWVTRLLRGLLLVVGRVLAVAILLAASYFPVMALFGPRPWTELLVAILWLALAYRAIASSIVALFSGRILAVDEKPGRRLERLGVNGLRIVFVFFFALEVVEVLTLGPEFASFVLFVFRVVLVAFPLYLYFAKDAVLALMTESTDSRLYDVFRSGVEHNYGLVMLTTAGILAMRAAGFIQASTFILVRGYALIGYIVLLFAAYRGLRRYLQHRYEADLPDEGEEELTPDEETHRQTLTRRLEQLSAFGLVAIGIVGALDLLLVLEPLLILLRIPFLAVGGAKISLFSLVSLALLILGAVLAMKLLRAFLNAKIYPFFEVDVGVAYAVNTILRYVFVVVTFLLALTAIGVDLTAITVVIASLGIGIGFGLQTLVENLISGFILLFGRSVEKGDYVTVNDTYGQVEAVGARSVIIKTPDNFEMLVPSKELVSGQIINWSYDDNIVRARLNIGVTYSADPDEVREVLLEATEDHPDVLDEPDPSVRLTGFGDSSVDFELLFFFDCRETVEGRIIGELNFDVWDALEEADITIPFPQRDLHFKSLDNREAFREVLQRRRNDGGEPDDDED